VELVLKGISYRANIFVNGEQVASQDETVGTFVAFSFDISKKLKFGKNNKNTIKIQIIRPINIMFPLDNESTDLSISFLDWNVPPPDTNMGLWKPVYLHITKAVSM